MSIGQAAKYIGVSRDTLRRWEKKGKIKAVRSPSNRRYYTKAILDAAMGVKKVSQPKTKSTTPKMKSKVQKLIIFGILSFAVAAALAIAVQFFLLK
ncbi:MAG TPA: MerR family DNA-binding transcriptional regulator [Nevskiaceae bacterium]|nr:MerR family DNA-binding transcriptional regulator [Nevskiaceae bacterium]